MREIWPWRFIDGANSYGAGHSILAGQPKIAFYLHAPRSGTLDSIEFKLGVVTTPAALKVSIQDINLATGDPDGVVDQFGVIPATAIVAQAWVTTTLTLDGTATGTKRTVTRGDWLAVVIEFNAGLGSLFFNMTLSGSAWDYLEHVKFFTSAWIWPSPTLPCYVLKYTDGVYATTQAAACAPSAITAFNPTVNTTPDEYALRVQVPFTGFCAGALVHLGFSSGTYNVVLYAPNGAILMSVPGLKGGNGSSGPVFTQFTSPVTLFPNAAYRLAVVPTTTTPVKLTVYTVQNCGIHDAHPGGRNWYLSTRTDAGVWTDTTLQRPLIAPFLVDLG
jgi:hypothetical protein